MHILQILLTLLGRVFLSLIFILSAIHKIFDWAGAERGLTNILCEWQSYMVDSEAMQHFFMGTLPWVPVLLVLAILVELIGGLMVFFGIKARFGAFLLIVFLIPTTVIFHQFWFLEGLRREMELVMFLKNTAIFGGLLYILAYGTRIRKEGDISSEIESPDLSENEEH